MNLTIANDEQELIARLQPLIQHLRLVANSSFWVVVTPTIASQARIADLIRHGIQGTYTVVELSYANGQLSFAEKIRGLSPPEQKPAAAFIFDLDSLDDGLRQRAIGLLNRGREALAGSAYTVILFVLAQTLKDIIHQAGDLWAWRSGVSDVSDLMVESISVAEQTALRERYLDTLIQQHRYVDMALGPLSQRIELEQVYVPFNRLMPYDRTRLTTDSADSADRLRRRLISLQKQWDLLYEKTKSLENRITGETHSEKIRSGLFLEEAEAKLDELEAELEIVEAELIKLEKKPEFTIATSAINQIYDQSVNFRGRSFTFLCAHRRIVLLGDPGSGKTQFLKYLLLTYARGEKVIAQRLGLHEQRLPVFISLPNFADAIRKNNASSFSDVLSELLARQGLRGYSHLILDNLEKGRAIVLLDGLDTVSTDMRRPIARKIESLSDFYPDNRYIVVSRLTGYDQAPLNGSFAHYILPDLQAEQIKTFVERWSAALGTNGGVKAPSDFLLGAINNAPQLQQLAAQPSLLLLMLLQWRSEGSIGGLRIHLYQRIVETLMSGRDSGTQSRSLPRLSEAKQLALLEKIALRLYQADSEYTLSEAELYKLVHNAFANMGIELKAPFSVEPILQQFKDRIGFLVETAPGRYGFYHASLQEYFVARALIHDTDYDRAIKSRLHQTRWIEPVRLAVAYEALSNRAKSEQMIERIVAARSPYEPLLHRDLLLGTSCLAELDRVSRRIVDQTLEELLSLLFDIDGAGRFTSLRERIFDCLAAFKGHDLLDREILPAFLDGLHQANPALRLRCVQALGVLGPVAERVRLQVAELLDDGSADVRVGALYTLGAMGRDAAPLVRQALSDTDEWVRRSAENVLIQLEDDTAQALIAVPEISNNTRVSERIPIATSLLESSNIDDLLNLIKSGREEERIAAIKTISRFSGEVERRLDALTAVLDERDSMPRAQAAEVLADICIADENITADQRLRVCHQLAQGIRKARKLAEHPSDEALLIALSRLVEHMTDTRQLSSDR